MRPLVEACCDSLATARAAQAAGAGRIELCGSGDGGTTPSHGLVARAREALHVPLAVMIRPRAGNFVYAPHEIEVMHADIVTARALGADAVVLGVLHDNGTIDEVLLRALLAVARPLRVTFHRAFDRTPDAHAALDRLVALGVDTVLTSGHATTARDGIATLRELHRRAGERLTIMACGGIRATNVREVVELTGVREVHARATDSMVFAELTAALGLADGA